jgi:hypothetical protein
MIFRFLLVPFSVTATSECNNCLSLKNSKRETEKIKAIFTSNRMLIRSSDISLEQLKNTVSEINKLNISKRN